MASIKELGIYVAIIVAVMLIVAFIASSYIARSQTYSFSVKMLQLNPMQTTYPYNIANFRIIINNTGSGPATGVVLATYLNNAQLHTYTIDNLGPGAGVSLNLSYLIPANGIYNFQAVVDPGHLLTIRNRNTTQSGITINVTPEEQPNIYTSVPNGNIASTQSFSTTTGGLDEALFIAGSFNLGMYKNIVDSGNRVVFRLLEALSGSIVNFNGAYTIYANSSSSYTAWLQGPFNATPVYPFLLASKSTVRNVTVSGNNVMYAIVNGTTSICVLQDRGWTKVLSYYNASVTSQSCLAIAGNTYNATQSASFLAALKADPNLQKYQDRLVYVNSTVTGSSLIMDKGNVSALGLFENNYGFFGSYIKKNVPPLNSSSTNGICIGFILNRNDTHVCSAQIQGQALQQNVTYILVNTTELNTNYTASLYSLVNRAIYSFDAQGSGSVLVANLSLPGNSIPWNLNVKSVCSFANVSNSIGCSVVSFNNLNSTLVLNITDNLGTTIRLNRLGCFIPGFEENFSVNQTVPNTGSAPATTGCIGRIPGFFGEILYFNLALNYTQNGVFHHATGTANVTDTGR